MAYYENQYRVNVEFLRANQPSVGRIIRLNHSADIIPPQLQGRVSPQMWRDFMADVNHLASQHPYTVKPSTEQMCNWAACFCIGAIAGFFCVNPDGGDYGMWSAEAQQLVNKWKPAFGQTGCGLSFQRTREYYLQIDLDPNFAMGLPVQGKPVV